MNNVENARTRAEALKGSRANTSSSTNRARLWAGLNRYLASEAEHDRKVAKREKEEADREKRTQEERKRGDTQAKE